MSNGVEEMKRSEERYLEAMKHVIGPWAENRERQQRQPEQTACPQPSSIAQYEIKTRQTEHCREDHTRSNAT
jgi:hypothetical protein